MIINDAITTTKVEIVVIMMMMMMMMIMMVTTTTGEQFRGGVPRRCVAVRPGVERDPGQQRLHLRRRRHHSSHVEPHV